MALKVYARNGGAAAAAQNDITARVPILDGVPGVPIVQMGMGVQNGGASQGTLLVPDPTANFDASLYFPPHTQITLTEDATGDELMLAQGRISGFQIGRAPGSEIEDAVEWTLTIDDANVDLRGLAFTEDWVRPAETGTARLYALALYTLNGTSSTRPDVGGVITYRPSTTIVISSTHLAPDTNTTVMPAKTYPADTQPQDVVNDCATTEGKHYGVVPHHVAGVSHLCMLYVKESDHSTYPSAVKISDQLADWDPDNLTTPVFEPIWDQGKGQQVDGNANISGIVSRYGPDDKAIVSVSSSLGDANEYWVDAYQDGASVDATQAAARAAAIIAYRSPFAETDSVTIELLPEQHHLITAGMSLKIKTAVTAAGTTSTLGTYVDRRIVSLVWEPRVNGKLAAIMELNRPTRGPGAGQAQPASSSPKAAPECLPDTVVAPVTIFHWTFTTDSQDDESSTYDIGLERTVPGGFGSSYGDSIGMDADGPYGHNDAGHFTSEPFSVSAEADYSFRADVAWHFTPSARNVDVRWYNISDVLIQTDRLISGSGRATGVRYDGLGATVTAPVGADHARIYWTNFAGLYADNVYWETPGSIVVANNDPFCLVDPGDSPYYMKTDDPRVLQLIDQMGRVGFSWKAPVRVATTTAGTLATSFENGDTVDGVVLAEGDRILVKDQASGDENGIYIVALSGAPTRADDMATDARVVGAAMIVSEGTTNADTIWYCTNDAPVDLGTTILDFTQAGSAGSDIGALLREHMHGVYLAAAHDRAIAGSPPKILWSLDGKDFTTLFGPLTTDEAVGYAGDPAITHWNGKWWLTHQFSTSDGRKKFTLMSSEDLVTWAEVTEVATGIGGIVETYPGAWARNEDGTVYVDPSDGRPRFVFTATTGSIGTGPFAPYEIHPTNDAMTTWSTAAALTGDWPSSIIDPFWIRHGDEWALWYKQNAAETVVYATSASLTGTYVQQETGDWAGWGTKREDPNLVKLDDGRWRIYIQKYTAQTDGIFWSESDDDWATWSALVQVTTDFADDNTLGGLDVLFIPGMYDHQRDPDAHAVAGFISSGDAAGGDLSGTYPNPSVVDDSHSHTSATVPSGGIGEILISDTPSTPLIFDDLIQNEAQDDLVYADP